MLFVKVPKATTKRRVSKLQVKSGRFNNTMVPSNEHLMSISPLNSNHMRQYDQNFKKHQIKLLPIDHLLPVIAESYRTNTTKTTNGYKIDTKMTPERVSSLAATLVENLSTQHQYQGEASHHRSKDMLRKMASTSSIQAVAKQTSMNYKLFPAFQSSRNHVASTQSLSSIKPN